MIRRVILGLLALLALAGPLSAQTITPQGRLSLSSSAVMTADVTGASTIHYVCYSGNVVPVGATPTNLTIGSCDVTMGLDAVTPHIAAGSAYDMFGVSNGGTLALCAGPAWSTTTSRGTGAGTTEINQTNGGLWTNANSLTNCWGGASGTTDFGPVAAGAGTYLGSLFATANGQTGLQIAPAPAVGGSNSVVYLYNAYNRIPTRYTGSDSTATWTYATATWRPADNSTSNRITWFDGLGLSQVSASYAGVANGAVICKNSIDVDSTTATPSLALETDVSSTERGITAGGITFFGLGQHYAQAVEIASGPTCTFRGGTSHVYSVVMAN